MQIVRIAPVQHMDPRITLVHLSKAKSPLASHLNSWKHSNPHSNRGKNHFKLQGAVELSDAILTASSRMNLSRLLSAVIDATICSVCSVIYRCMMTCSVWSVIRRRHKGTVVCDPRTMKLMIIICNRSFLAYKKWVHFLFSFLLFVAYKEKKTFFVRHKASSRQQITEKGQKNGNRGASSGLALGIWNWNLKCCISKSESAI